MNRRHSVISSPLSRTAREIASANTPHANPCDAAPAFCSVDDWYRLSGFGHSATYKGIAEGWLPSIKVGKSRRIDFYRAIEVIRAKFGTGQAA